MGLVGARDSHKTGHSDWINGVAVTLDGGRFPHLGQQAEDVGPGQQPAQQ
jgi:hypothetical protein